MGEGYEGDEEKGSHEAPCNEGSSASGHEGYEGDEEEGSHEAPCHEGSSSASHEGYEGDEEEGSHEAPRHEGSSASTQEGHEVSIAPSFCVGCATNVQRYYIDSCRCVEP